MKAIHILSTAPQRVDGSTPEFIYRPFVFEVISTVLSALLWRTHNGSIKLYTDKYAYDFYKKLDLLDIWDAGVDVVTLDRSNLDIDPRIFWASSKLIALQKEVSPIAMIDTDLFVWKDISPYCDSNAITVLHRENLIDCYPDRPLLKVRKDYVFDEEWDWKELPCNTAFAYFPDQEFMNYYLSCAFDFMNGNKEMSGDMSSQMVFAEQRILAMCAKKKNVKIQTLVDDPFQKDNDIFTHIWGAKRIARNDQKQRVLFEHSMMRVIKDLSCCHYDKLRSYMDTL